MSQSDQVQGAEKMTKVEQMVTQDLEIGLYPFKWKEAQRMAESKAERGSFDYWMAARKLFLELGGRYVGQKN